MGRSWAIPSAAIVAAMMLTVMVPVSEASASSTTVVFSTDFEGNGFFITAWEPLGWSRGDYAYGHEDDLWCRTNASWREVISDAVGYSIDAHSKESALYGAKLGTNSENGFDNLVNGYPDPGMDSWVRFTPPNAASYDGMTLTFWYWAKTQAADYTGELTDYLCVNINDGSTTKMAWKQSAPDSNGWQQVTVDLPAGTVWMEWEFKTSEGAINHYPGVFIDDVTVTTSSPAAGSPTSKVGGMYPYYDQRDVFVPVTMSDADSLYLYYRNGSGPWTKYTDDDHPDGALSAPITFHAPGDGRYELYAIAGNESKKSTAEASFTVDTTPPTVSITSPKQGSTYGAEPPSLAWTSDDLGGIKRTEVSIDDGPWNTVSLRSYPFGSLADGAHTAVVKVTDNVGRSAEASVSFVIDPTAPAMTVSPIGDGAAIDAKIVASFQEAVDRGSVNMTVAGVSGDLSWAGDDAVFTPSSLLQAEKTYEVEVMGTKAGGQAFSVNWSFTTVTNIGSIAGTVHDPDGRAVPNATVKLSNGMSTTTDTFGHFELKGITPGKYALTVSGEGYADLTRDVEIIAGQAGELGVLSLASAGSVPQPAPPLDLALVALLAVAACLAVVTLVAIGRRGRKGK